MQASRSNMASDLQKSNRFQKADRQPDQNVPRSLPSPFSAPIQAARKYLERQRNDGLKRELRDGDLAEPGSFSKTEAEESSRERDRRLERSLYEGHSIEAGLSFDGLPGGEARAAGGHASLAESDGSEPLFSYAPAEPVPNPEIVRGAIGRLARSLQPSAEASRDRSLERTPERIPNRIPDPIAGRIDDRIPDRMPKRSLEPIRSREWGAARTSPDDEHATWREATAVADDAPPPAFGDVARQVWSSGFGQLETGTPVRVEGDGGVSEAGPVAAAPGEINGISEDAAGADRGYERLAHPASGQPVSAQSAEVQGISPQGTAEIVKDAIEPAGFDIGAKSGFEARPGLAPDASAPLPHPRQKPVHLAEGVAGHAAEEDAALAHDACNLLSALALYSELLGSSGVLVEQYRHYAGDLKLLASRSQVLINRLLLAAASGKERRAAVEAGGSIAATAGGSSNDAAGSAPKTLTPSSERLEADAVLQEPAERTSATAGAVAEGGTDRGKPETESTSLADLLLRWGSLLSTLAHGTLDVVLGPQAAMPVPASAEAVERILVNLVRNARAATADGGAIRIGVGVADRGVSGEELDRHEEVLERLDEVDAAGNATAPRPSAARLRGAGTRQTMVLTVDDSGCGMTAEQIRRILRQGADAGPEPSPSPRKTVASEGYGAWQDGSATCSQASEVFRSSGSSGGSDTCGEACSARGLLEPAILEADGRRHGLGLQVVRGLVASSGGTLSIESQPGRGTRIEIRWPVAAVPAETAAVGAETKTLQQAAERVATASLERSIPPSPANPPDSTGAAEQIRGAVGPDGFNEMELRAMMLRLHRNGPQQRGRERVPERVLERVPERNPLGRRLNYRSAAMGDAGRGFGLAGASVAALAVKEKGQSDDAHDVAAKGAIAC